MTCSRADVRCTTMGAAVFHFCVRNGNRWYRGAVAARQKGCNLEPSEIIVLNWPLERHWQGPQPAASRCSPGLCGQDIRIISAGKLHPSRGFHIRPINVVVSNVPYRLEAGDDSSRGLLPA